MLNGDKEIDLRCVICSEEVKGAKTENEEAFEMNEDKAPTDDDTVTTDDVGAKSFRTLLLFEDDPKPAIPDFLDLLKGDVPVIFVTCGIPETSCEFLVRSSGDPTSDGTGEISNPTEVRGERGEKVKPSAIGSGTFDGFM
jgi:hypothetical protein